MRNINNRIVKKIAALALAVAGLGLASQTSAQDAQCASRAGCSQPIGYIQPIVYVRIAGNRPYENPNALRDGMESVGTRLQADLDASPQWACANAESQKAMADVMAAEERIRQSVSSRPDYQSAAARKQAAQQLAADLRQSGASVEQIIAAAQSALEAGKTLTQIEQQAAAGDLELIGARARVQEVAAARQEMQAGVRAAVLNDPQWQHTSRRLENLQ
jgi:hypothetical protein